MMESDDDDSERKKGGGGMNSGQNNSTAATAEEESFLDKMKRMTGNCCKATGLCCFKAKEQSQISALEFKVTLRQKKFGVDYLNLVEEKASQKQLKDCLQEALRDIGGLQEQINEHYDKIDMKTDQVNEKIKHAPGAEPPTNPTTVSTNPKTNKKRPTDQEDSKEEEAVVAAVGTNDGPPSGPKKTKSSRKSTDSSNKKPMAREKSKIKDTGTAKKGKDQKVIRNTQGKATKSAAVRHEKDDEDDEFRGADPSKWKTTELKFAGSASYEEKGKEEKVKGTPVPEGIETFKANPAKYVAMMYQTDMLEWPGDQHEFIYVHRAGTKGWKPQGTSPSGWMTVLVHEYQRLPPLKDNVLPKQYRDKYTDAMTFCGRKLHSKTNKPILPGRGMGVGDTPLLKVIGDVDPSDIAQGAVGDCWLLSGISSLAEFDGAVKRLFRKTKNLDRMPMDDGPNMYTVTLWDLPTWTEVDIQIDERLCANHNGSGQLLASKPSEDGELWVCYLEKALAAHCGGWDKIVGGQCTHAWALLTGCKEQYTIRINEATGKYACYAKFDPHSGQWARHANSPHDCDQSLWRVAWPEVGGGGGIDLELDEEELFLRLCAWDNVNYIVGAGTRGVSDKNSTEGIVDNHAYSVIESVNDVAGTDIDLLKVRNPWGKGEIEDGDFDDDGPGWDRYPQIKKALNPVVADDGIFWVTKKEFFNFFETIYLSASNMTEFLED